MNLIYKKRQILQNNAAMIYKMNEKINDIKACIIFPSNRRTIVKLNISQEPAPFFIYS